MLRHQPVAVAMAIVLALTSCSPSATDREPERPLAKAPTTETSEAKTTPVRDVWSKFGFGAGALEFETFDSLESMVGAADATVLATVKAGRFGKEYVDVEPGKTPIADIDMVLRLRIDEVLAGTVGDHTKSISLVMGPYDVESVSAAPWETLVGQQSVFALRRNGVKVVSQWGTVPADPEALASHTYHVVYSGGLLDEAPDSSTRAPWAEKHGWTRRIEGRPFAEVLARIRAADR